MQIREHANGVDIGFLPGFISCPHLSIRAANNGVCPICDAERQALYDQELARLQEEENEASEELARLDADAAKLDLAEFVRQGWHVLEPMDLEWNWHHEALCRNVQGMFEEWLACRNDRKLKMRWQKLAINICPSSLKSRIIMVYAVAWMWLRCPTWSVLCVSMNPANVNRDSEDCRTLVTSAWYRETFGITWTIRSDIDSKAKWATTAGGRRVSRGLKSKFTGIHVDCHLIDDPDDAHDVYSEAERKERVGKIESLSSRLNDKRLFVTIMSQQRVHVDDATGDALSRGGWLHANYALEYSAQTRHDTPFYTDPRSKEGDNLHELRFTTEVIASAKLELGTQGFEAQYNGNPSTLEGGMFKRGWFRFFRIADVPIGPRLRRNGEWTGDSYLLERNVWGQLDLDFLAITVDATFGSTSDTASAVGLLVIGGKGPKRFVFMDRTRPMTYPQTKEAIRQLLRDYPAVTQVLIEKKANGQAIIDELEGEFAGVIGLDVEGGKESRASAMSPAIEAGTLYLLDGESWLDEFLTELCQFPNGKRDDRVDALSQLMNRYRESLAAVKLAKKNAAILAQLRRS